MLNFILLLAAAVLFFFAAAGVTLIPNPTAWGLFFLALGLMPWATVTGRP